MSVDLTMGVSDMLAAFGESVQYRRDNILVRTITAVVDRGAPTATGPGGGNRPSCRVSIANSATTGIDAAAIDLGIDSLWFANREGGTAERHTIRQIVSQDSGMIELETA